MADEHTLQVAQLLPDTGAEGPGRRFAVWTQGCPLRCPGCCNPQMLPFGGGEAWPVPALTRRVLATAGIEGLSLLGGEPFVQAAACASLARGVRRHGLSVVVFSGYTLAELRAVDAPPGAGELLATTDLLVDGRYDRRQPEQRQRWIGSRNQELCFLTGRYRPDDPCFSASNTVELRLERGVLVVSGWPAAAAQVAR